MGMQNPTTRLLRWAMKLQILSLKLIIEGKDNAADGYSRINKIVCLRSCKEEINDIEKKKIIHEYRITLGHDIINNMKAAMKDNTTGINYLEISINIVETF